jgi:2-polyprenyl-6-methoxyphenol hydroxylase-like FAD-dependent oxidoreductase
MTQVDVLIVGGSLGGLMTANSLLRAGFTVLILEKSPITLDGRGAGIVTHSRLLGVLARCGVAIDDTLGVSVDTRVVLDQNGNESANQHYPQLLTSWGRLYNLLKEALPQDLVLLGAPVTRIATHDDYCDVHCADGRKYRAALTVAADGIRSSVRTQLLPHAKPVYAGYVAWRGICDESALSANTLTTLFNKFGFGLPEQEQILGYPVAGPNNALQIGKRCYNTVWYRPAQGVTLKRLMTDADGIEYSIDNGGGIAPNKVNWREIAAMRNSAIQLLAPQFAEVVQKTAQPFLQAIFDLVSPRIAFGRTALLGDAAFVARPHVGMGVTKAAEDSLALTKAIVEHGLHPNALAAYEKERLLAGTEVVERGRRLGAYLQSPNVARSAPQILSETAIDLALQTA